ncbi:zinc finger domain-containing protein [Streptomyces sp. DT18]
MTPNETVILARYVRALCPQQKFDEYTPDAWHDVLEDQDLTAARRAAAVVARRQPWVSPAEIINEIRESRAVAAADFQGPGLPAEIPDADPDDVPAYLAAIRAQRTRAANGAELKPRPMKQLLAGIGRTVPAEHATVRRPGPLGRECPTCNAPIGRPCRTPSGAERAPHTARRGDTDPAAEQAEIARRRTASAAALGATDEDRAAAMAAALNQQETR